MKIDEVPQDHGMAGDLTEVCYAVDASGRYELVPSLGWEPKNVVNSQAWQLIETEVAETLRRIEAGHASPLAYHMVRNQMNLGLLAKYVRRFKWQVRRDLTPKGYAAMTLKLKQRYADLFDISVTALDRIPKQTGERS